MNIGETVLIDTGGLPILWSKNLNTLEKLEELRKKYNCVGDLDGREVVIMAFRRTKINNGNQNFYKVFLESEPEIDFFVHEAFLSRKKLKLPSASPQKACKCNVFVTGCICGVFQKEQAR